MGNQPLGTREVSAEERAAKARDMVLQQRLALSAQVDQVRGELQKYNMALVTEMDATRKQQIFMQIQLLNKKMTSLEQKLRILNTAEQTVQETQQTTDMLTSVDATNVVTRQLLEQTTARLGASPHTVLNRLQDVHLKSRDLDTAIGEMAQMFDRTAAAAVTEPSAEMAAYEADLRAKINTYQTDVVLRTMPSIPTTAAAAVMASSSSSSSPPPHVITTTPASPQRPPSIYE